MLMFVGCAEMPCTRQSIASSGTKRRITKQECGGLSVIFGDRNEPASQIVTPPLPPPQLSQVRLTVVVVVVEMHRGHFKLHTSIPATPLWR
jgi:hypothetical protein